MTRANRQVPPPPPPDAGIPAMPGMPGVFGSQEGHHLHPGRLTWNLQITHFERKMIFQTSMIMFHVNLPGCIMIHFKDLDLAYQKPPQK